MTLTPRDAEALVQLARFRVLSFSQFRRLVFPNRDRAVASRSLKRLRASDSVTTWDEPVQRGGSPRYILPTASGLRWGLAELRRTANPAVRPLLDAMLPTTSRRPLVFEPWKRPAFLDHQNECTMLAAALLESGIRLVWISTWDRPFPNAVGGVSMPQPDFVALIEESGSLHLVFGEHDRGHESLAHFAEAKVRRYAQLARLPVFCRDTFGFSTFRVWVTVLDAPHQRPLRRLRALSEVARVGGASDVMAFSLAGWLHAFADLPIWFHSGLEPDGNTPTHAHHLTSGLIHSTAAAAVVPDRRANRGTAAGDHESSPRR
ncbi:MAG TPA: replication-relaxation family protein [Thermoanaerobaculia bacterium]|nr:replication-relaxation family protein [Thermoanaerobaculia bacterium]